jgi:glycerol-3-phosphate acyltransferase PlsY
LNYIILSAIWAFACYFIGTISVGELISKLKNVDIRSVGTGNPGASNIYAEIGPIYGISVFFIDIAKGLLITLPVILSSYPTWIATIGIIFFLIGHMIIKPWGRPGGIGMATTIGAGIALLPLGALIAALPSFLILIITRRPAYAGVFAFVSTIIAGWLIYFDLVATTTVIILAGAVLVKFQFQYRWLDPS